MVAPRTRSLIPAKPFWPRIDVRADNECWPPLATQGLDSRGRWYVSTVGGMNALAHRVAYTLTWGEPDGVVCHSCDYPPCCNPAHLWTGTQADNLRDMQTKGRGRNGNPVVTEEQDRQVLELWFGTRMTQREIGEHVGVSRQYVSKVVNTKSP